MARDDRHRGDRLGEHERTANRRIRSAATVTVTGGVTLAAIRTPGVLLTVAGMLLLLYLGVILPAVWSSRQVRRRAASMVLQELLGTLRHLLGLP